MSRFDDAAASDLARCAFRCPVDEAEERLKELRRSAPLIGKERELLTALQEAEAAYDEWREMVELQEHRQQFKSDNKRKCNKLRHHLEAVISCWESLGVRGQSELATLAYRSWPIHQLDSSANATIKIAADIDDTLRNLLTSAEEFLEEDKRPVGRQANVSQQTGESLKPLIEFSKILGRFWENTAKSAFKYEDDTENDLEGARVAVSAGARLLFGAAKILNKQHTLGNVETAMQQAKNSPD